MRNLITYIKTRICRNKLSIIRYPLSVVLSVVVIACGNPQDDAALTIHLGGGSASYSASALDHWPPEDAELDKIVYNVKLTGPSGQIVERKDISGDTGTINFEKLSTGLWTVRVEAFSDSVLYAYDFISQTLRRGKNDAFMMMQRADDYKIVIKVTPADIPVAKGKSYVFSAATFAGSKIGPADLASHSTYNWFVEGNKSSGTSITSNTSGDGYLTVGSDETAATLTIRAESVNSIEKDDEIFGTVTVTVITPVTNIILDKTTHTMVEGTVFTLTATVMPVDAMNKNVTWSSSDDTIATVNNGIVTAIEPGTVIITAIAEEKTAQCTVNVLASIIETTTISMELVWIPSGTFMMDGNDDGGTTRPVTLTKGYYMGKYQVTQEQYEAVMGINPSNFSVNPDGLSRDDLPVEMVSWYDALVFCNKLSIMEGLTPVYSIISSTNPSDWGTVPTTSSDLNISIWNAVEMVPGATGYRLPTEAEWEYACRAGTTTAYNTGWDGTTVASAPGWYSGNSGSTTHEVGLKTANAWGLYDMHGNVWEWCWDWYGSYVSGSQTDPVGVSSASNRVVRGGSWATSNAGSLRSAYRGSGSPGDRDSGFGFRVLRP